MHQRQELSSNLSEENFSKHLNACLLQEKEEYTEDEFYRFRECQTLIAEGRSYEEIAQLFQQSGVTSPEMDSQPKTKKSKNGKKPPAKPLDFLELLSFAKELLGTGIPPKEALKLLEACGLSADAEQYSQPECDRFLEGCELVKKKNKSYEEVATHFGNVVAKNESVQQIEQVVAAVESQASELTGELIDKTAEAQALSDAQRYLASYARAATGPQVQNFWSQLKEHCKARLEGKSSARFIRAEPQPKFMLPSSPSSTDSSKSYESGMTDE